MSSRRDRSRLDAVMPTTSFGAVQQKTLTAVATTGVHDLRPVTRALPHHQESVSRAVHALVDAGELEWHLKVRRSVPSIGGAACHKMRQCSG